MGIWDQQTKRGIGVFMWLRKCGTHNLMHDAISRAPISRKRMARMVSGHKLPMLGNSFLNQAA